MGPTTAGRGARSIFSEQAATSTSTGTGISMASSFKPNAPLPSLLPALVLTLPSLPHQVSCPISSPSSSGSRGKTAPSKLDPVAGRSVKVISQLSFFFARHRSDYLLILVYSTPTCLKSVFSLVTPKIALTSQPGALFPLLLSSATTSATKGKPPRYGLLSPTNKL